MKAFSVTALETTTNSTGLVVDLKQAYSLGIDVAWEFEAVPTAPIEIDLGRIDQYTWNFADIGTSADGDFIVLEDATGALWAAALDVDGTGVANAGAVWTSVAAAKKTVVDISALTDDEDIAAAVKAALELLVGFTAKFTLTDNGDGTVLAVTDTQYAATSWGTYNIDESGAGSTSVTVASAGANPTVHTSTNTIDATAHGFLTGMKARVAISAGSLPSPLSAGVDYFVIRVNDDSFKLATTRAFALAGTAIDITTEGTDSQTITVTAQANAGTVVVEYSIDLEERQGRRWRTYATTNLVTDTSPDVSKTADVEFHAVRPVLSVTAGILKNASVTFYGKGT
jgi:hypothetical protein